MELDNFKRAEKYTSWINEITGLCQVWQKVYQPFMLMATWVYIMKKWFASYFSLSNNVIS